MAINLSTKPNTNAPDSTYPYGSIRDRVGATPGTPVNAVVYQDFNQFFARIAANAGITLNDLADNADNGFQYVQALNKIINAELSGLAEAVGAGGLLAVKMSGMVLTTPSPPTTVVSTGWFFYNGQYVHFLGGSYNPVPGGDAMYVVIGETDGLPTATLLQLPDTTPDDATQFQMSHMCTYGVPAVVINPATPAGFNVNFQQNVQVEFGSPASAGGNTINLDVSNALPGTVVYLHIVVSAAGRTITFAGATSYLLTGTASLTSASAGHWIVKLEYWGGTSVLASVTLV